MLLEDKKQGSKSRFEVLFAALGHFTEAKTLDMTGIDVSNRIEIKMPSELVTSNDLEFQMSLAKDTRFLAIRFGLEPREDPNSSQFIEEPCTLAIWDILSLNEI